MNTFRDLLVWQKSMTLVKDVYTVVHSFPKLEEYGLSSQMRRCCISIPLNIAEGFNHKTKKEYLRFLSISYGSCSELETQIEIAHLLKYITKIQYDNLLEKVIEVSKMLHGLSHAIYSKTLR